MSHVDRSKLDAISTELGYALERQKLIILVNLSAILPSQHMVFTTVYNHPSLLAKINPDQPHQPGDPLPQAQLPCSVTLP